MKLKLCLISAIVGVMSFIGIGNVNAQVPEWNNIANYFKTLVDGAGSEGYTIKVNPTAAKDVQVSLKNPVYGDYFIKFVYDESGKTITYTADRSVENRSDQNQIYCRYTDDYFVTAMFYAILHEFKIAGDTGIDMGAKNGVNITYGKDLTYGQYHEKAYQKVEFNLNTMDSTTTEVQNQGDLSRAPYQTKLKDLKTLKDPMGDCLEKFNKTTTPDNPTTPDVKTTKNPKTGLNLPIVGGIAVLGGLGIAYLVIRKKNLFANM